MNIAFIAPEFLPNWGGADSLNFKSCEVIIIDSFSKNKELKISKQLSIEFLEKEKHIRIKGFKLNEKIVAVGGVNIFNPELNEISRLVACINKPPNIENNILFQKLKEKEEYS